MQTLTFVRSLKGIGKASGKEYDFLTLSDGIEAFNVGNPNHIDFSKYKEGDKIAVVLAVKSREKKISVDVVSLAK